MRPSGAARAWNAGEPLRGFGCLEGKEALLGEELALLLPLAEVAETRPGVVILRDSGLDPRATIADPVHPALARAEWTVWEEVRGAPSAAGERVAIGVAEAVHGATTPPRLHVWVQGADDRDRGVDEARAFERSLRRRLGGRVASKIAASVGDEVIDVVHTPPERYLVGAHRRTPGMSAFPGGQRRLSARPDAPSRAHLKLEEGLEWSELPIRRGDVAIDVGCAPGGWSLILLERGLTVHGVDTAPVADDVRAHPSFRAHAGPVRTFRSERIERLRWIFCDMNGPPVAALGQLERLASRCRDVEGIFHTIKLSDDRPLVALDDVRRRLKALAFKDIRVRHLYHNRDELTVVARR